MKLPARHLEGESSVASISILSGTAIGVGDTLIDPHVKPKVQVELQPDSPTVIGRSPGWCAPYLDQSYESTTVVPGTGQTVLLPGRDERDFLVSRAHFMLRPTATGILLVNGVPRAGGGIRPPRNGTRLTSPVDRAMADGEEFPIARGEAVIIRLPNGTELNIGAG